jgi:phosphate/phosphite/phosphonate ABC transporter binding protein
VRLEELCEQASQASGVRFTPWIASSYKELADAMDDNEVGLAWMPPLPTLDLVNRGTAEPLAIPARQGTTSYHAALLVRRGQGPKTLAALQGRRVAWVDRESAAGYLVPRIFLAAQGIDVLRFFSREVFVHAHSAVIDAVATGDVDVGATYCHLDASGQVHRGGWLDEAGHAVRPLEVLATMGPIPNDALVAARELPVAARSGLLRWLVSLDGPSRERFDRVLSASEFRVPAPDHFDALRHVVRAARARGHDALPSDSRMRMRVWR